MFRANEYDRDILRLAVPALGSLAAEPLYVLVDTAVVGHLGTDELAGLGVASSVLLTSASDRSASARADASWRALSRRLSLADAWRARAASASRCCMFSSRGLRSMTHTE